MPKSFAQLRAKAQGRSPRCWRQRQPIPTPSVANAAAKAVASAASTSRARDVSTGAWAPDPARPLPHWEGNRATQVPSTGRRGFFPRRPVTFFACSPAPLYNPSTEAYTLLIIFMAEPHRPNGKTIRRKHGRNRDEVISHYNEFAEAVGQTLRATGENTFPTLGTDAERDWQTLRAVQDPERR